MSKEVTVTDSSGNSAAIKGSSTAPLATDPAMVVALSPNSSTNSGTVSAANSSTATLGSGAAFTGTSESTLGFEAISVTVMAIGASAPPGTLSVQQSSDGTNWDVQDSFSVSGGTASPTGEFDIIVPLLASNFRIVYTNGATAQTAFRLQTIKWAIKTSVPNAVQKGVQPATSVFTATQDAKDSGRVVKTFSASAAATTTTDTMITLTPTTDFTAGATGTSFTITAGKRLRIQAFTVTIRTAGTAAVGGQARLRISASGAVTTATTMIASAGATSGSGTTVASWAASAQVNFPDGLELSGTMQLGVSQLCSVTTGTIDVSVIGYEY